MDKKLQSYETIFVVDVTKGEETVKAVIDRFTSLISANGEITQVNDWGKRRLAYPINDKPEGYYVLINFRSESSLPLELERVYGITEGIVRFIVIRHEDKKPSAKAVKVAQAREAAAAAAPKEEPKEEVKEEILETVEEVKEAAEEVKEEVKEAVEEAKEAE